MGGYAILNIPKIKKLLKGGNVLIESLYSWEEYLEMKEEFSDSFNVLEGLAVEYHAANASQRMY